MAKNLNTILFLTGVLLVISGPSALAHNDITAKQARELIGSTGDLTIIDVREPSEYSGAGGHIPGALNYPLNSGSLQNRYEELPMDGPILVVCGSGSRSHRAAKFLDSVGFSTVYDMQGGMSAWTWEKETSPGAGTGTGTKYSGGTGEPNDPYQIATAKDLITLGETPEDYDKHFLLIADIDLNPDLCACKVFDKAVIAPDTDPNDKYSEFQGIPFTGSFDGGDHVISRLTITGRDYLGLFGSLGSIAEIKNLGLVDVSITGTGNSVGGLAGANYGDIACCYCTGTVTSDGQHVGGLVGYNTSIVAASLADSSVTGGARVGGLIGFNGINSWSFRRANITNCCASGTVAGDEAVGGLVGMNGFLGEQPEGDVIVIHEVGFVTNCYSTSIVIGSVNAGGLVGDNQVGDVVTSFWDIETSGQAMSLTGVGKTTAEMQTAKTFLDAGWDFVDEEENGTDEIWSICEGTNYPRLVWQIPVGDFVCPDGVTIEDFAFFMEHWLDENCDSSNDYCEGTDLDRSGKVDVNDLEIFFESWSAQQ